MSHGSYDFIILGAGISGLLLGAELSKKHSVLILERENKQLYSKYWVTDSQSADLHPKLAECISQEYSYLDYLAYNNTKYRCKGKYVLWDGAKLISHLKLLLELNKATIIRSRRFYSYKQHYSGIEIHANDEIYSSAMVIDCMGYSSPLIYAKNVLAVKGYYLLYGATLRLRKNIDPIAFHNVIINSKPSYLEIFPTGNGEAHTALIIPQPTQNSDSKLRDDFEFIVRESSYKSFFYQDQAPNMLGGIIPVGIMKKRAIDRIYFYGEAGQVNPPATATGLTIMLKSVHQTADYLSKMFNERRYSGKDLSANAPRFYSKYIRRIQMHFFKDLLKWNSDQFLRFIKECKELSLDEFVNGIVFGSLNLNDYENVKFLRQLYATQHKIIFRYFLKSFLF